VLRIARAVAVGFPHHVVQRGNNRGKVFFNKKDREKYLSFLKKYADKWDSPILAYCLMSNHVHLLVRPNKEESLRKMMQGVALCHTQYINRTYKRTGRLWESRYHSCIVDEERYLWVVAKYIEQNPIRAGVVKKEEDFPYSSARAHIGGVRDEVLAEELFEEGQRKEYIEFIRVGILEDQVRNIRYSTKTGRPLGSEEFIRKMEKKLGRQFVLKSPGRPRKRKGC